MLLVAADDLVEQHASPGLLNEVDRYRSMEETALVRGLLDAYAGRARFQRPPEYSIDSIDPFAWPG